jgi:CRISPR-associated protein Csx16
VFLNVSNHPSTEWGNRQRREAEALGGQIKDEPFPEVSPDATQEEVRRLGAGLVERIAGMGPAAAMIQGEFTLAFWLVRELELRRIPCYAATTQRVMETNRRDDGAVQKVSRFEFVRFRRYC